MLHLNASSRPIAPLHIEADGRRGVGDPSRLHGSSPRHGSNNNTSAAHLSQSGWEIVTKENLAICRIVVLALLCGVAMDITIVAPAAAVARHSSMSQVACVGQLPCAIAPDQGDEEVILRR